MTLDDLHQKLSNVAFSGMEDNYFVSVNSKKGNGSTKGHMVKTSRRRLKKELSVQLSLFD
ncbi:hypothetical protein GQ41_1436 [Arenibacter algicola]|jgi:hypothetical protein|uniref:50S ribosomal protein L33 n=1 Tax=Arenibacter algicola TaxID=616991 RepID=A0ABY3ACQ7_9FLAO|tara:strand:- start:2050 stop:2229 length:180 start_codon:yes stop_codon:yes gene_type:complete